MTYHHLSIVRSIECLETMAQPVFAFSLVGTNLSELPIMAPIFLCWIEKKEDWALDVMCVGPASDHPDY